MTLIGYILVAIPIILMIAGLYYVGFYIGKIESNSDFAPALVNGLVAGIVVSFFTGGAAWFSDVDVKIKVALGVIPLILVLIGFTIGYLNEKLK